jgi:NusA N-terminal domain
VRNELSTAILALTTEKDLPREIVVAAVEEALGQTYRKQYGTIPETRVSMDLDTGQFRVLGKKTSRQATLAGLALSRQSRPSSSAYTRLNETLSTTNSQGKKASCSRA